jgi:P-type conjugative transfer protein TrbJ
MRTMNIFKRASAIVSIIALLGTGRASATGIPVFDASTFGQSLITAQRAVQQVANQATQIANQVNMIQNQIRSLMTLGEGSFSALTGNLNNQLSQLTGVLDTVRGVGYQISSIEDQFKNLFPPNGDWSNKLLSSYSGYFQQWSDQLQGAAQTAMKSQAVIANIRADNAEAQNILAQSKASDGEVRQLQAVNSMLGILTNQLGDMTMAMTTSDRLTASALAAAQAEKDARRAAIRRYTTPVDVPIGDGKGYGQF